MQTRSMTPYRPAHMRVGAHTQSAHGEKGAAGALAWLLLVLTSWTSWTSWVASCRCCCCCYSCCSYSSYSWSGSSCSGLPSGASSCLWARRRTTMSTNRCCSRSRTSRSWTLSHYRNPNRCFCAASSRALPCAPLVDPCRELWLCHRSHAVLRPPWRPRHPHEGV